MTNPYGEGTPIVAPAGWYPDPRMPGTLRYWDGRVWTEHLSPVPPPATSSTYGPKQDNSLGYALAVLLPIVGLIYGIVNWRTKNGPGIVAISVICWIVGAVIWSAITG